MQVTVDLPTLLHLRQHPGELLGYGPIPAEIARELAGDAAWQRFVHEPVTGYLLDAGDERYQPPPAITRFRVARDVRCRFPGSTRRARDGDGDHVEPHRDGGGGGRTSSANLASLSKLGHIAKTHNGWKVTGDANGVLTWTSPNGHTYTSTPHDYRARRRPTTVLNVRLPRRSWSGRRRRPIPGAPMHPARLAMCCPPSSWKQPDDQRCKQGSDPEGLVQPASARSSHSPGLPSGIG